MLYGVDYYPEVWPRAQWPRDLDLMAEAGLTVVRVGDLCWASMELRPAGSTRTTAHRRRLSASRLPLSENVLHAGMDRPAQGANPGRSILDVSPPVPALAARDQRADRFG
jgi:hypothetical protein